MRRATSPSRAAAELHITQAAVSTRSRASRSSSVRAVRREGAASTHGTARASLPALREGFRRARRRCRAIHERSAEPSSSSRPPVFTALADAAPGDFSRRAPDIEVRVAARAGCRAGALDAAAPWATLDPRGESSGVGSTWHGDYPGSAPPACSNVAMVRWRARSFSAPREPRTLPTTCCCRRRARPRRARQRLAEVLESGGRRRQGGTQPRPALPTNMLVDRGGGRRSSRRPRAAAHGRRHLASAEAGRSLRNRSDAVGLPSSYARGSPTAAVRRSAPGCGEGREIPREPATPHRRICRSSRDEQHSSASRSSAGSAPRRKPRSARPRQARQSR